MTRRFALFITALTMVTVAACSKEEAPKPASPGAAAPAAAPASDDRLAKIPILPGYKYYAGGPAMKEDEYGRFRLARFNGEVQQPPSRGMIFGAKSEGDQLEYTVWGNGIKLALHRGVMRNGVFWQEYAESYRNGKLVARERTTNEDEAKRSKVVTEDIDPETGEVIRTKEMFISYLPPAPEPGSEDEDEDDDAEPEPAGKAAPPAAATPPGAK